MAGVDEHFRSDIEARMRMVERTLLEHVTKCDGRARMTQWMIAIGFGVLVLLTAPESPLVRAVLSAASAAKP